MKLTKEEMRAWMLDKVKNASHPYEAECWLVTVRTMGVDFEVEEGAYRLHCQHKNITSSAETLQRMYMEFSSDPRFWDEIMQLIDAVKDDTAGDEVAQFRRAVFQNLLPDLQQTILLELAEKQAEKVEQCRYLLLLLRLFPDSASMFGEQLIDVLTDLEKNAEASEPHENVYSQLLVSDVLPILLRSPALKLSEPACLELFKRAARFYLSMLSSSSSNLTGSRKPGPGSAGGVAMMTGSAGGGGGGTASLNVSPRAPRFKSSSRGMETPIADHSMDNLGSGNRAGDTSWESLLQCFSMIAERCRWDVAKKLKNFRLDHLQSVLKALNATSPNKLEVLFTSLLIFLNLVFKYFMAAGCSTTKETGPTSVIVLIPPLPHEFHFSPTPALQTSPEKEAPAVAAQPSKSPSSSTSAAAALLPREAIASATLLPSSSSENDKSLTEIFAVGKACMKLLGDGNREELVEKLVPSEKRVWVKQFVRDAQLLNGEFRRVASELEKILDNEEESSARATTLKVQLASCYLATTKTNKCVKTLLSTIVSDSEETPASSSPFRVLQPFEADLCHFSFVTEQRILDYTIRCVIHGLCEKITTTENNKGGGGNQPPPNDLILGHAIVLSQYEWPRLSWLFGYAMKRILPAGRQQPKRTRFSYPKFFNYVYCVDILEDFAHLNSEKSAGFTLDITETETTRKIGASTRHSVRDQKDDVRSMLEARVSALSTPQEPSSFQIFHQFLCEQKASLIELI